MKILVCGASGFVGSAIANRLERDGHQVIRGVRQPARPGEIAVDYTSDLTPDVWLNRLDGIEAVVNAVGILVERGTQTFEALHTQTPIALFTACRMQDVKQVVQISALGVESRETPYFASKYAADEFLLAQPIRAHVLRPSLIYGTNGTSARMFRMSASLPVHMMPAGGRQQLQPVHLEDLAELVARLLDPDVKTTSPPCLNVVGNTPVTYREMLDAYRKSMGLAPAFAITIPACIVRFVAFLGGKIPGSPLTPDTWRMLQRGNTADAKSFAEVLGHVPMGIETFIKPDAAPALRTEACSVWQGWMLRIALAIVWIGSAVVSAALYPHAESLALLGRLNLHEIAADVTLYGACLLDFGLGIATLLKPGRKLWLLQMAVILIYSTLVAVALPEFLIDPFGPILKNIPMLALLTLLLNEEIRS